MDKQEAIEEIKKQSTQAYDNFATAIHIVNQIDEQQKPIIPKFRVWDTVKKAMSEVKAIVYTDKKVYPIYFKEIRRYIPFNEAILMQSTGLFDKNGKEIFEGDVVRMHSGEFLPVNLHHGMFEPVCYYNSDAFKKVGNVFENPELVEEL